MKAPFHMTERDIDLMLLEELHSDTGFVSWFTELIGIPGAEFITAEHSVSTKANAKWGETDVLAYFKTEFGTFAALIEDKIGAQFADRQAERYQERAREMVASGLAIKTIAVLCAPQDYLKGVPPDDPWDQKISFEDLVGFFDSCNSFRGRWRTSALQACLAKLSHNRSAGSDDIRRFSTALRLYLHALNEGFDHAITGDNWGFIIKTLKTPAYVELAWKNNRGQVNLTFSDRHVGKASKVTLPDGTSVTLADGVKLKSDIFAVDVPTADVTLPFDEQLDVVSEVMKASRALLALVPKVLGETAEDSVGRS